MHLLLALTSPAFAALPTAATLPGDDTVGRAAGTQDEPVLVDGDGTAWLLAWRDNRAGLADTLGSDTKDVYAIRLGADGAPLDTVSFPVANGPWTEQSPRAAWNGTDWLVAFDADAPTTSYWGQGVAARRVDGDGTVLDAADISLVDEEYDTESVWDVASDGAGWAVIWQAVDSSLGSYVLDGAVVAADGTTLGPQRVYTPASNYGAPVNAEMAWSTDRYLVAYSAWDNDDDIMGLTVDADLASLGSPFAVVDDSYSSVQPTLAAGGGGFYVSWYDDSFGAYWGTVKGTPVGEDGTVGITGGETLSGTNWPLDVHPDAAWTGSGWGVAWEYGAAAAIYGSLVDTAGTLGSTVNVTGALDYTTTPVAAGGDDGMIVSWVTQGEMSDADLKASTVASDGTLGAIEDAAVSAPAQTHPAIAGGSGGYLVVSESQTADEVRILAWRTNTSGAARDAAPIEIAAGIGLSDPAVAWNGTVWLVVWVDLDPSTAANGVVGVRVDSTGTVLDASPIAIFSGYTPAVAASTAGDFLVAGTYTYSGDQSRLQFARVSSSGTLTDTTPVTLASNYAEQPDVCAFGSGWMVVDNVRSSHDSSTTYAYYSVVQSTGTASAMARVRTTGSAARETDVNAATDGSSAMVVWADNGDIRGRRIDSTGALVGNGRGFTVGSASNTQFDPDIAWSGRTNYSVVWTDWRAQSGLEPGVGDVYATQITSTGRVTSTSGVVGSAEDVPEGNAVVAGASGRVVYVWTKLHEESPYAAFRLETTSQSGRLTATAVTARPAPEREPVAMLDPTAVGDADGTPTEAAGCATSTGGAAGLGTLVAAAALVTRRRRGGR